LASAGNQVSLWISDVDGGHEGFPVPLPEAANLVAFAHPVIGDVDGDGAPEVVVQSINYAQVAPAAQVQIFDARGRLERVIRTNSPASGTPSLADLDGDGIPEIVLSTGDHLYAWNGSGEPLPGWPIAAPTGSFSTQHPAVGDVDGDGRVDVVTGGIVGGLDPNRQLLFAFRCDGVPIAGFPKTFDGEFGSAQPVGIADLDLDGRNEIIAGFFAGIGLRESVFVYDLHGPGPYGPIEWQQKLGGPGRTGYYETGKNLANQAVVATQVFGAGRILSGDGGIACHTDCIERYSKGAQVVLTAVAQPDATFQRWRGACAGQGNPCTIAVGHFTQTSADFASPLRVTLAGAGKGTVTSGPSGISCPTDCAEAFAARTLVTLTASAPAGNVFEGWGGACSGTQTTCTVFMEDAENVTATFNDRLSLTVLTTGAGTATYTSAPNGIDCTGSCVGYFVPGSAVTLNVMAAPDSYVVGINYPGCFQNLTSCLVTMNGPQSVTVWVERKTKVAVTIIGNGSVVSSPAGVNCAASCDAFLQDRFTTLSAAAAPGWRFARWEGACSARNEQSPCVLQLTSDIAVTAVFERIPYVGLDFQGSGQGTVQGSNGILCTADCDAAVDTPQQVTLTAIAAGNSTFGGWGGACSGVGTTCQLNFTGTSVVVVTFNAVPPANSGSGSSGGGGGGGGAWSTFELAALGCLAAASFRRRVCRSTPAASRTRRAPSRPCGSNPPAARRTSRVDRCPARC
jgi:hypothetical protein